jgi:hypothetical protein
VLGADRADRQALRRVVKHGVKHLRPLMSLPEFAAIMRRAHSREERHVPLFMDVHSIEGGVSAADSLVPTRLTWRHRERTG